VDTSSLIAPIAPVNRKIPLEPRNLLDLRQVADRLGLTAGDVRHLVDQNRIPYLYVGPFLRFDPTELDRWRTPSTRGTITIMDAPAPDTVVIDDGVIDVAREERDRTAVAE
jgi:excisionase family DNA binding protein